VRHFLVVLVFLDFWAGLGFQGRFLTVESGSRFLGHPVGGKLTLIMLHQTPPYENDFGSILRSPDRF
jgi:hypothetical protein